MTLMLFYVFNDNKYTASWMKFLLDSTLNF